jgi:hypothetical protein
VRNSSLYNDTGHVCVQPLMSMDSALASSDSLFADTLKQRKVLQAQIPESMHASHRQSHAQWRSCQSAPPSLCLGPDDHWSADVDQLDQLGQLTVVEAPDSPRDTTTLSSPTVGLPTTALTTTATHSRCHGDTDQLTTSSQLVLSYSINQPELPLFNISSRQASVTGQSTLVTAHTNTIIDSELAAISHVGLANGHHATSNTASQSPCDKFCPSQTTTGDVVVSVEQEGCAVLPGVGHNGIVAMDTANTVTAGVPGDTEDWTPVVDNGDRGVEGGDRDGESGYRGVDRGDRGMDNGDKSVGSGDKGVDTGDKGMDSGDKGVDTGYRGVESGDKGVENGDKDGEGDVDTHSLDMRLQEVEEQLQNIFTPTPVELIRLTLVRSTILDDWGFSLSDGVYEKGVYVSNIRVDSQASSQLVLYDRLLQVGQGHW